MKTESPMRLDRGEFKAWNGSTNTREYSIWQNIRYRCYSTSKKKDAGYAGCTVSDAFISFQAFAAWATKQIGFMEGFQLDKDLLVKKNRIYAPDKCVFLPLEVNSILIKNSQIRGNLPIGVKYDASQGIRPYVACISVNQKNRRIGSYATPEDAFHAYKEEKEAAIKAVAEKYKTVIDPRAYAALMAYQVEITD